MYGNDSKPSVIYKYGAKAPIINKDLVEDQMFLGHRYYNKLVEIELERRKEFNVIVSKSILNYDYISSEICKVKERIEEAEEDIKAANVRGRGRKATKEEKNALKLLRLQLKELNTALKVGKRKSREQLKNHNVIKNNNEKYNNLVKEARGNFIELNLYWGTYLQVEQSLPKKSTPPKFHRWTGRGKIAVQIQHGMTVERAFSCKDNRLRIVPVHNEKGRTKIYLRIGTDEGAPVWAVVPFTMHRPIPSNSIIKWVFLLRNKVASKDKWSICFVLSNDTGWAKSDLSTTGIVGVDLGWRITEQGLRVACWAGDDGQEGTLTLPISDINRWQKAKDLQSIRSQNFDIIKDSLIKWLKLNNIPEWLKEQVKTIKKWRSQNRLARVIIKWDRFEGDEQIYTELEAWRKQDKHLWEWEYNQRRKAIVWREDTYRNFTAMLSRKYKTVCLEKINWSDFMAKVPVEDNDNGRSKKNLRIASPGQLSKILSERFREVVRVNPAYTSKKCNNCGTINEYKKEGDLFLECNVCGKKYDRDFNAAKNLMESEVVSYV